MQIGDRLDFVTRVLERLWGKKEDDKWVETESECEYESESTREREKRREERGIRLDVE